MDFWTPPRVLTSGGHRAAEGEYYSNCAANRV